MKGMMLFADSFEDIEALGTLDLIRRAKIDIDTVSITGKKEILTQSKVYVLADKLIEEINLDEYDFLIIPGGAALDVIILSATTTLASLKYVPPTTNFSKLGKHVYSLSSNIPYFPRILGAAQMQPISACFL